MKRKLLCILTALCLLLSACGGQTKTTEPATLPGNESTAAQPTTTVDHPQGGTGPAAETTTPFAGENVQTGGRDAVGLNAVVSTGREDATQIGLDILKAGGNAIDAAVAIGFALGVSEQQ